MNNLRLENKTLALTWLGALTALQIIFGRLTIGPSFLKVGLSFIVVALIGYYFGPFKAVLSSLVADILANVIFPPQGGFFWGFTLSAMVTGVIYGFMLHDKNVSWRRLALTVTLTNLLVNLVLNTVWVSMLSNISFITLFKIRLFKELIFIPIQTFVLSIVFTWLQKHNY
ncbi:folate family ECF transporter S component [Bombilactobacillus thymidiniphilus]|uniref:Folate family ECF transporter S component n=1 Tax=Bombilactobacillus thymidiniphilus TaxID=2923363 RepID=A0ABY4PF35_9LACO|nr:folate family ECF transporter S component [Bombilactobacillus thymidiniphilus]UQS83922.1 folate family ECF transporter S component [Bombilactobacillus thymidiniphilus]